MEDFVPFDLAVKLKEKGFDYKCLFVYNKEQIINPEIVKAFGELTDDGYYELTKEGGGKLDWSFVYINEYQLIQYRDVLFAREMIKAPTISQVLKWLREEKLILIGLSPMQEYDGNEMIEWCSTIYKADKQGGMSWMEELYYESYEQAALAGIEYVLDNLI